MCVCVFFTCWYKLLFIHFIFFLLLSIKLVFLLFQSTFICGALELKNRPITLMMKVKYDVDGVIRMAAFDVLCYLLQKNVNISTETGA